jgi:hypothetical protein
MTSGVQSSYSSARASFLPTWQRKRAFEFAFFLDPKKPKKLPNWQFFGSVA